MLRRREVEEREVQYYDLGSRTFGRSTSLVGVDSTPVLHVVSTRSIVSRFGGPLLSRRTRAPEILDGNNKGHAIPFPVPNGGLIGIEGFGENQNVRVPGSEAGPKNSPRQN